MFRSIPICLLLVSLFIPSCGGGGSSSKENSLEEALPDHQETLKPCVIRLERNCIINIKEPVAHPKYEAVIIFEDDMALGNRLTYSTRSLSYLISPNDPTQVSIQIPEMTPSNNEQPSRKHTLSVNITWTSTTQGTATWESVEGPDNSTDLQKKSGAGTITVSEI